MRRRRSRSQLVSLSLSSVSSNINLNVSMAERSRRRRRRRKRGQKETAANKRRKTRGDKVSRLITPLCFVGECVCVPFPFFSCYSALFGSESRRTESLSLTHFSLLFLFFFYCPGQLIGGSLSCWRYGESDRKETSRCTATTATTTTRARQNLWEEEE